MTTATPVVSDAARTAAIRLLLQAAAVDPDEGGCGYAAASAIRLIENPNAPGPGLGYNQGLRRFIRAQGHTPVA